MPYGFHLSVVTLLAEDRLAGPFRGFGRTVEPGLSALLWGLVLIFTVPVVIFLSLRIARFIRIRREKEFIEQMKDQAMRHEKAGEFVSAAVIHEKLKDPQKAAGLYERGGDFEKAASLCESLGDMKKASELCDRAGDSAKAAELCMAAGDFVSAARIYNQRGDKLRAAQALEMTGNRLAAVRAYREARGYEKAAELLGEEGMHREAAEMYGFSLAGEVMDNSNAGRFYSYASLLEAAGEAEKAGRVYREIAGVDPGYRDVLEKAEALAPKDDADDHAEDTPGDSPKLPPAANLKSFCLPGMEPRYAFRLWVQVMKSLSLLIREGDVIDNLSPESIRIDSANTVTFDRTIPGNFSYVAPEVIGGRPQDESSLIYSMGVILYEMLAGSLDAFGLKPPGEVIGDVPPWLDELAVNCTQRDRSARYQSFDEIF
jgi:tetratricopeptide (TPR) repeat protein